MSDRKVFLETLRDELKVRIERYSGHKHREGGALEADFAEQAVQRQNDEVVDGLDLEAREELVQVEKALQRLDNGDGDACELCGALINPERLKALPQSTVCVACAEKMEEE